MTDEQIVNLYWQRSERAIRETEDKYGSYCQTIAYHILKNRQDAEECVSDTWLAAWNAMPDKRPARLSPFLGRITRNAALNRVIRRRAAKRGGGEAELALEELADCVRAPGSPDERLEAQALTEALERFVRVLPETERRVFLARYWYAASEQEIAGRLGCSRGKVRNMLRRTRQQLQNELIKEGLCEMRNV